MNNTILIQLPTDPTYFGMGATSEDLERICDNLESMIRSHFADAPFELEFERTATPRGSGIHGDNLDALEDVRSFIAENWTAAL